MRHAATRIAVLLAAAVSSVVVLCCQQILGLDPGKSPGSGGTSSATVGSTSTGGSSTTGTGASSTVSSSGTGGGADCTGMVTISMANLIDDMEEGSSAILERSMRQGFWFTYNDQSDGGVQTPTAGGPVFPSLIPDGGRCGSLHAMHTFGSGFTSYGVGLGFDLNHPPAARMTYDVSKLTGIAFWGLGPQDVEVQVVLQATASMGEGGTCMAKCDDHFHVALLFTAGWQQYVVPFSVLTQKGFGAPATWDPTTVFGVQFAVNPAPMFDYWIDDVGLY
jgi:hypothetical protein